MKNTTTHTSASDRSAVNVNESTDHTTMNDEIQSVPSVIDAEKIYKIIDNQQLEKFLKDNQSPWTNSKSMTK